MIKKGAIKQLITTLPMEKISSGSESEEREETIETQDFIKEMDI